MGFDAKFVREAFQNTGPRNPLRKLSERERMFISACLVMYKGIPGKVGKDPWEQTAKTTREAATLAKKISQVLKAKHMELLKDLAPIKSHLGEFEELPGRLSMFAGLLGNLLIHLRGKPGHEEKVMRNRALIMASEFVRCRTGKYYDEHLAELFQAINSDSELKDFSGDAIRRKREHFKKIYPILYATVRNKAVKLASGEALGSGHSDAPQGSRFSLTRAMGLRSPKTRDRESDSKP